MPSFRVSVEVGALRPGVRPPDVLPALARAAAERAIVEAQDLRVVAGRALLVIRFEAEGDPEAAAVAAHTALAGREIAEVRAATVTRRVGGRWLPLRGER